MAIKSIGKVIIILGPTASGKTSLSIELAKKINSEIISADSMQIYKFLNIGTAKPTKDQMQGIKHHLIDIINPDSMFNVSLYKQLAEKTIEEILAKNKVPIIVGGTGLYINSLIYNIKFEETITDYSYRNELKELAEIEGNQFLHNMLRKVDYEASEKIHPNNIKRVIRALEVFHFTGIKITDMQKKSRDKQSKYEYLLFGIDLDREILYKQIDLRVDNMFEKGLLEEISNLIKMGFLKDGSSRQAIGYKEILLYFENKITLEEAKDIIKMESRRYAKRQMTWFKKIDNIIWLNQSKQGYLENIMKRIE